MRRIGTLPDPALAGRFADFLVTLKIDCIVDQEPVDTSNEPTIHLWVRDESHVETARKELEAFRQTPHDPRYDVKEDAEKIRKEKLAEERRKQKLRKTVRHRSAPSPLAGLPVRQQSIPVVKTVLIISIILGVVTLLERGSQSPPTGQFSLREMAMDNLSFANRMELFETDNPWVSIQKGQIWRLITPVFLHGSPMHLAFNMLAMWVLGSAIERLQGSGFLAFLFVFGGVFGNVVQVMLPPESQLPSILAGLAGSTAIGASGSVYALFGYLWVRPLLSPMFPINMPRANIVIMIGWLFFCLFAMDGIANGAHFAGLGAGVLVAAVVARFRPDF
ncbi:MAG: rhomboid family intramembrane serine protease [Planctomycetota bacterium]